MFFLFQYLGDPCVRGEGSMIARRDLQAVQVLSTRQRCSIRRVRGARDAVHRVAYPIDSLRGTTAGVLQSGGLRRINEAMGIADEHPI